MRNLKSALAIASVIATVCLTSVAPAEAQGSRGRPFGLGGQLGDPSGINLKFRFADHFGLQVAAGWGGDWEGSSFQVHADFLWSLDLTSLNRSDMLFYFGVGPQLLIYDDPPGNDHDDDELRVGVRVPLGLDWEFRNAPVDVFIEIVPGLVFIHDTVFDLDSAVGARYWF